MNEADGPYQTGQMSHLVILQNLHPQRDHPAYRPRRNFYHPCEYRVACY